MAQKKRTVAGDGKASAQVTNQGGYRKPDPTQPDPQQHQHTAGAIRQTQPDLEHCSTNIPPEPPTCQTL